MRQKSTAILPLISRHTQNIINQHTLKMSAVSLYKMEKKEAYNARVNEDTLTH